ncbi:hypothetical protein DH2020_007321 [Rehmannia glutinosa]|uniref:Uncharacterized protein n=1 Tax=Rehmannia glutinosa TaxID=99300 RepID=A0ABR0TY38_REHGL
MNKNSSGASVSGAKTTKENKTTEESSQMKNFDPTREFENDETAYDIHTFFPDFQQTNDQFDSSTSLLQFAIQYQFPWIIKWEYALKERDLIENDIKLHVTFLGRNILIKWWAKEDFFGEGSAYSLKGIRSLKPAHEIMRNMNHQVPTQSALLKELLQHMDKDSVAKLFKEVFEPVTTGTDKPSTSISSKDKNIEDTEMNDAQNPYEDEDLILEMMNKEYEG